VIIPDAFSKNILAQSRARKNVMGFGAGSNFRTIRKTGIPDGKGEGKAAFGVAFERRAGNGRYDKNERKK
jgi:hypothetical protein